MDKRFVTFLVLAFLIWTTFLVGRAVFLKPQPPVAANPAEKLDPAAVQPGDDPAGKAADPNPEKTPADPAAVDPAQPNPAQPNDEPQVGAADGTPTVARASVTIGSLDPTSPYTMLVTLDNRGAAVERVELNDPRFRDIEDQSGYLGHLGFALVGRDTKDATVQTVGPGTPASLAKPVDGTRPIGLQVGDVIREVNGAPIERGEELESWLRRNSKPGQSIEVTVDRTTAGKTESLKYTILLTRRPLEMIRPETRVTADKRTVTDPLSMLLTLETLQGVQIKAGEEEIRGLSALRNGNWEMSDQSESGVTFSMTLTEQTLQGIGRKEAGSLKITKRYSLPKAGKEEKIPGKAKIYHLDMVVGVENTGDKPLGLAYRLDGPNGIPLEGWWYSTKLHRDMFRGAGARDVLYQTGDLPHHLVGTPMIFDHAKKALKDHTTIEYLLQDNSKDAEPLTFLGVDAQFFAAMVMPVGDKDHPAPKFSRASAIPMHDVTQLTKTRIRTTNTSVRMVTPRESLDAGKSLEHRYQIFLGPKDPDILRPYGLEEIVEFGWWYAAYPAMLLRNILTFLYSVTGNYGIAIILLTVLVRTCMLPFSIRQSIAAKRMQEISQLLKPELTAVKEKYKDDPLKQHQATQELMKKAGMPNPFAGCLLVFFQLPVFVGLYRCLSVDIHLRDASLFPGLAWASNLAGPDKLYYWRDYVPAFIGDEADGWLGPFFNVLPLVTIALFIVQQKLFTPPPTDEQQEVQQQTMMIMSLMMGVFFYKVPAGLCLYFITSSLWSVAERTLLPKSKPIDPSVISEKKLVTESSNGSSARAARKQKKR
ncbi:Membrane protein insertase YidC [Anatilimnocola aggregata]|uniref:Membrane protein insertase YidC n=1 Tax=Anatilimnocola aggregata TaxID=2528021 RepID=A0A517YBC0_9BACT|nr:membrane protein insertase YidC [Anatilimnocola aggregata]QDU27511.1 Membrane protein insertase YidC [Anatilimnocola aggregata]